MTKIALSAFMVQYNACKEFEEDIRDVCDVLGIRTIELVKCAKAVQGEVWVYPVEYKDRWWASKGELFPKEIVLIIHDGKPHIVLHSFYQRGHDSCGFGLTIVPLEAFDLSA